MEFAGKGAEQMMVREVMTTLKKMPARLLIAAVRFYQATLSNFLGRQCRFTPTCSEYFIGAVKKYGAVRGGLVGLRRIFRCHPFGKGGYDPIP